MIGIINYGVGNITSVKNACAAAGCETALVNTPTDIVKYSHLLLPGVGAFGECVRKFHEHGFTADMLRERVMAGVPLLGVCVGMQMLATVGEEFGIHDGLNLIPGRVVRFAFSEPRVPHVGWNNLDIAKPNPLFLPDDQLDFYFVHSYHYIPDQEDCVIATCDYGGPFTAVVGNGRIFGTQFHPEKSFPTGLKVLKRFSELC